MGLRLSRKKALSLGSGVPSCSAKEELGPVATPGVFSCTLIADGSGAPGHPTDRHGVENPCPGGLGGALANLLAQPPWPPPCQALESSVGK